MSNDILINGKSICSRATFYLPWNGAGVFDLELSLDKVTDIPSGKVAITVGSIILTGTVDPRYSASFATKASIRVVAGAGGWDTFVPAQHFHGGAGQVTSTIVYAHTAQSVGETVTDPVPVTYPGDYVRSTGAASRIFGTRNWYVDPTTGVTIVSAWLASTLASGATISDFDTTHHKCSIWSNELVLPGTVLTDTRFNGTSYVVSDVEHSFSFEGSNMCTAWVQAQGSGTGQVSRLTSALANMVKEFAQTAYLRTYQYTFVGGGEQTLQLQAVTPGAPNLNPIAQWSGLSGAAAKITPGTSIVVGFIGGDPSYPYLVSFSPLTTPIEIDLAGGANYLVPAPWATSLATALGQLAGALTSAAGIPSINAAGTALTTALGGLPPAATTLVKGT